MQILKLLAATAAIAVAAPLAAQALPPATIVLVDMEQVFATSLAGKQAQSELKTRADGLQARVQALRTQFGAEEAALVKTQPTVPGPARTAWEAKAKDYAQRKQTEEQTLAKRGEDIQLAGRSVAKQLNDAAQPIISAVMRERGASIVLAEGATLQHTAALDVTTDVIARLDKVLPRVSTATPAPK